MLFASSLPRPPYHCRPPLLPTAEHRRISCTSSPRRRSKGRRIFLLSPIGLSWALLGHPSAGRCPELSQTGPNRAALPRVLPRPLGKLSRTWPFRATPPLALSRAVPNLAQPGHIAPASCRALLGNCPKLSRTWPFRATPLRRPLARAVPFCPPGPLGPLSSNPRSHLPAGCLALSPTCPPGPCPPRSNLNMDMGPIGGLRDGRVLSTRCIDVEAAPKNSIVRIVGKGANGLNFVVLPRGATAPGPWWPQIRANRTLTLPFTHPTQP